MAQWPLDGNTGLPKTNSDGVWQASNAYRLPGPRVQGAVSTSDRWYVHSTGNGATGPGHLQTAEAGGSGTTGVLRPLTGKLEVGIGVEDLSYWPGLDELWTATEHPGKRIIYSTSRP